MTRDKVILGRLGEEMARLYYAALGYEILATRFRTRDGELDLVVRLGRDVAFVEVKTRRGTRCGSPAEAVTPRKLARMRRVAGCFLTQTPVPDAACYRFDVAAVILDPHGGGMRLSVMAGVS